MFSFFILFLLRKRRTVDIIPIVLNILDAIFTSKIMAINEIIKLI